MTIEDHAAQIFAVDGLRNRTPEVGGAEPCTLVLGNRSARDLVEPHEIRIERSPGIVRESRRTGGEAVEIIAVEDIDQVKLAALEAQHLDVAIRLNVEPDGIQIWQAVSLGILFPVVGIAAQEHARSRLVFRNQKWAEHGRFFFARMRGHDRDLIEESLESGKGCGKSNGD